DDRPLGQRVGPERLVEKGGEIFLGWHCCGQLLLLVRRRRSPAVGVVVHSRTGPCPLGGARMFARVTALSGRGLGDFKVGPARISIMSAERTAVVLLDG